MNRYIDLCLFAHVMHNIIEVPLENLLQEGNKIEQGCLFELDVVVQLYTFYAVGKGVVHTRIGVVHTRKWTSF